MPEQYTPHIESHPQAPGSPSPASKRSFWQFQGPLRTPRKSAKISPVMEPPHPDEYPQHNWKAKSNMTSSLCQIPLTDILAGHAVLAQEVDPDSIMTSTTRFAARACLSETDLLGLNYLYPSCHLPRSGPPQCIKGKSNSGWLRLGISVLMPFMLGVALVFATVSFANRREAARWRKMQHELGKLDKNPGTSTSQDTQGLDMMEYAKVVHKQAEEEDARRKSETARARWVQAGMSTKVVDDVDVEADEELLKDWFSLFEPVPLMKYLQTGALRRIQKRAVTVADTMLQLRIYADDHLEGEELRKKEESYAFYNSLASHLPCIIDFFLEQGQEDCMHMSETLHTVLAYLEERPINTRAKPVSTENRLTVGLKYAPVLVPKTRFHLLHWLSEVHDPASTAVLGIHGQDNLMTLRSLMRKICVKRDKGLKGGGSGFIDIMNAKKASISDPSTQGIDLEDVSVGGPGLTLPAHAQQSVERKNSLRPNRSRGLVRHDTGHSQDGSDAELGT